MKIFDLKKFLFEDNQIGRFDYIKITYGLAFVPFIFMLLCIVIPYDNIFYPLLIFSVFLIFIYTIFCWIAIYKRFNSIFDNKSLAICLLIAFIILSIFVRTIPDAGSPQLIRNIVLMALLIKATLSLILLIVPGKKPTEKVFSTLLFWTLFSLMVLTIVFAKFLGFNNTVYTMSMENTLKSKDMIFSNAFDRDFKRGDIVLFKHGKMTWISRIIGLPGETVEVDGGRVYINNSMLNESYLSNVMECNSKMMCGPVVVPDNSYYIMGDNRANSMDSRFIGFVDKKLIKGKVSHIFFPLKRRKIFKTIEYKFSSPEVGKYMDKMQKTMKASWKPPIVDKKAQVKVIFTILQDGKIINPNILQTSGFKELDKSAIDTIKKINKLDPLPKELTKEGKVDIEFTFDYNLKKKP